MKKNLDWISSGSARETERRMQKYMAKKKKWTSKNNKQCSSSSSEIATTSMINHFSFQKICVWAYNWNGSWILYFAFVIVHCWNRLNYVSNVMWMCINPLKIFTVPFETHTLDHISSLQSVRLHHIHLFPAKKIATIFYSRRIHNAKSEKTKTNDAHTYIKKMAKHTHHPHQLHI